MMNYSTKVVSIYLCTTETGRGIVLPGHCSQVTVEQLDKKLCTAKEKEPADGGGKEGKRNSEINQGKTQVNT